MVGKQSRNCLAQALHPNMHGLEDVPVEAVERCFVSRMSCGFNLLRLVRQAGSSLACATPQCSTTCARITKAPVGMQIVVQEDGSLPEPEDTTEPLVPTATTTFAVLEWINSPTPQQWKKRTNQA